MKHRTGLSFGKSVYLYGLLSLLTVLLAIHFWPNIFAVLEDVYIAVYQTLFAGRDPLWIWFFATTPMLYVLLWFLYRQWNKEELQALSWHDPIVIDSQDKHARDLLFAWLRLKENSAVPNAEAIAQLTKQASADLTQFIAEATALQKRPNASDSLIRELHHLIEKDLNCDRY